MPEPPQTPQSSLPAPPSTPQQSASPVASHCSAVSSPTASLSSGVSEDGSMKSITTKVEQEIPVKFSIPSFFRADIMEGISSSNLKPTLRNALVRDLVVHMYICFGVRPSKRFCSYSAKQLILKYPSLRDVCGTGYVSAHCILVTLSFSVIQCVGLLGAEDI